MMTSTTITRYIYSVTLALYIVKVIIGALCELKRIPASELTASDETVWEKRSFEPAEMTQSVNTTPFPAKFIDFFIVTKQVVVEVRTV